MASHTLLWLDGLSQMLKKRVPRVEGYTLLNATAAMQLPTVRILTSECSIQASAFLKKG